MLRRYTSNQAAAMAREEVERRQASKQARLREPRAVVQRFLGHGLNAGTAWLASATRAEGDGEVPRYDARLAVAAHDRDEGVRKVRSLTVRGGIAGVAFSLLFGGFFAHHAEPTSNTTDHGRTQQQQERQQQPQKQQKAQKPQQQQQQHHSKIVTPAQPPKPASGSGQVTSGAS
jgi:hypothetical protein